MAKGILKAAVGLERNVIITTMFPAVQWLLLSLRMIKVTATIALVAGVVQRHSVGQKEAQEPRYTLGSMEKFVGVVAAPITYPGRFTRILIKKIRTVLMDGVFLESRI